jgi:NADPH2:quinone reductase
VITTVSSPEKAELARAAGAQYVVNYTKGNTADQILAIAADGVDIVVEVSPAQNAELNLAITKIGGCVSVYANNGGDTLTLDVVSTFARNLRYQFILLYTVGHNALENAAADVTRAAADGALPVGEPAGLPLHRFPLERTADAHQAVEDSITGKVLIDVSSVPSDN